MAAVIDRACMARRRSRARAVLGFVCRSSAEAAPAPGAPPVSDSARAPAAPGAAIRGRRRHAARVGRIVLLLVLALPAPAFAQVDGGSLVTGAIAVINFLGGLFGFGGSGLNSEARRALNNLSDTIRSIGREVAERLRDVAMFFASVWAMFRKLWARVLLPMLQRLDRYITRIFTWLRDTFGPIIDALVWLRRKILEFYDRWFRPILDTIDAIRGVLRIFSFFGLDWARRLDAALAEIQDRINQAFTVVMSRLNEVIDWVDRIVTLDGLLQRVTLLRSLLRYERDMWKVWWESIRQREAEKGPIPRRELAAVTPAQTSATVREYALVHGGADANRIDEHVADLVLTLRGIRPLPR